MITEQDLQEAIAECEGQKNPNANTCIKLAAFYTIKEYMFGNDRTPKYDTIKYSYSDSPKNNFSDMEIDPDSDTEFSNEVRGMTFSEFFDIMDELMSTLQIVQPRLYDSVIRKIKDS